MKKLLSILLNILVFASTAWADDGKWDFNPYDFQYDMTAYVNINVDGNGSTTDISRYSVAAFCGEECRGIAEVKKSGETQYGYLRIRSNQESGEQLSFKVYDNDAGIYLKSNSILTFASQEVVGLPGSPFEIAAANKYKVVFLIDDAEYYSNEVYYGENIITIDAPEKEGHTFAKWIGVPETMPAHDITVTGSYTINTYKLVFVIGDDVISEETVEYASTIVEPTAPEKEGHTFAGWSEHPETMPAHDLTITGTYTVNKYKLTYVIGEDVITETEVDYGSAITAIEAPEKEGYTFDGWVGVPETMPAHDVTVTGSYTINSYKLVFMIGEDVISEETVEYASTIVEPTAPEKEGHTFAGWSEHPETMPAHELTITGTYTVNKYKLTYVIGEETISETEVDYGSAITAIEAPEKEGYTFDGWVGVPETMPAHDVTVTGSYTINTYKLVFMIGEDVISESIVEYASTIVEPTAPEKEGHTFSGWSEHLETMPAHDLVITGSYTVNIYTVTYMIEDGEVVRVDEVEFGATLPEAPEAPVRQGYDFKGWSEIPEAMPAENITIVGSYEITTGISTGVIVREEVVYDIRGNIVKKNIKSLPSGVYIINGQKVMIR